MYTNPTSAVLCGGKLSEWLTLHRGVLSAKLYLIFVNDLINELEDSKQGALLHDLNASSPVQADDISIITTNRQSSQIMVDICEQYSVNWSFTLSACRSKLLQCGKQTTGLQVYPRTHTSYT